MKSLLIFLAGSFFLLSIQSYADSFDIKEPRWK